MRPVVLVLLVGLAACGGASTSPSLGEVERSLEPTPRPTLKPTAEPSPSPDAGREAATEFLGRALNGSVTLLSLYEGMVTAVSGQNSAVELQLAAREMSDWTDQERSWLLDHQPDECYAEAWAGYLEAVEAYRTLGDLMQIAAADPTNDLATQTALAALEDSTEALSAAGKATESMTCAQR